MAQKENPETEKKDAPQKGKEIIKEIHKPSIVQGRVFQIENRHAKVVMSSNFEDDRFPNLAAIGIRLIDHLAETKKIVDSDEKDHV
jgi:hypothetical protein